MDYEFPASLTQALADQHAIVEAFNPSATIHQERIVRAALAAPSVQRLITPDFSSDTFHPHANGSTLYWTALITGPFFDWGIAQGIFWVDRTIRMVTAFRSGAQRVNMSGVDVVGRATMAVLRDPGRFCDRPAYFADFTVSSKDLVGILHGPVQKQQQQM